MPKKKERPTNFDQLQAEIETYFLISQNLTTLKELVQLYYDIEKNAQHADKATAEQKSELNWAIVILALVILLAGMYIASDEGLRRAAEAQPDLLWFFGYLALVFAIGYPIIFKIINHMYYSGPAEKYRNRMTDIKNNDMDLPQDSEWQEQAKEAAVFAQDDYFYENSSIRAYLWRKKLDKYEQQRIKSQSQGRSLAVNDSTESLQGSLPQVDDQIEEAQRQIKNK